MYQLPSQAKSPLYKIIPPPKKSPTQFLLFLKSKMKKSNLTSLFSTAPRDTMKDEKNLRLHSNKQVNND